MRVLLVLAFWVLLRSFPTRHADQAVSTAVPQSAVVAHRYLVACRVRRSRFVHRDPYLNLVGPRRQDISCGLLIRDRIRHRVRELSGHVTAVKVTARVYLKGSHCRVVSTALANVSDHCTRRGRITSQRRYVQGAVHEFFLVRCRTHVHR